MQIPDSLEDHLATFIPKSTHRSQMLTHCRRELVHEVWRVLLDDEFIKAYEHGIVLNCADGILRRVYPRIFTLSADYKEKFVLLSACTYMAEINARALLAAIRDRGLCPCPRCVVSLTQFDQLGSKRDSNRRMAGARSYLMDLVSRARHFIYNVGFQPTAAGIERMLKPLSLVPTIVSHSHTIASPDLDIHPRMHSLRNLAHLGSTHILCLSWI